MTIIAVGVTSFAIGLSGRNLSVVCEISRMNPLSQTFITALLMVDERELAREGAAAE
jgi:hypothetical protein